MNDHPEPSYPRRTSIPLQMRWVVAALLLSVCLLGGAVWIGQPDWETFSQTRGTVEMQGEDSNQVRVTVEVQGMH